MTGSHRRPRRGGLHLSKEQLALLTLLGLVMATVSSSSDVIGIFDSPPPVVVVVPSPTASAPAGSADEMIAYFQASEHRSSSMAQRTQAEIEALAGFVGPGDRTEIVERIRELSVEKADHETDARYFHRALHRLTADT